MVNTPANALSGRQSEAASGILRGHGARWQAALRLLVAANLLLGGSYLSWRYLHSLNWAAWPVALALVAAETYSYVGAWLFGVGMWRVRRRGEPPPPLEATVDVFITCYNEPVDLVRQTVRAALAIRSAHRTYVLDDGKNPAMGRMAAEEGADYLVRSADWQGKAHHAKAGNVNNALLQTAGELLLILDADQIPAPAILERTVGYFRDPTVAFVQTPQWFSNIPPGDPFGCDAALFYGPIQQGKDGWNAAFFCGSNAVLRREALLQLGLHSYVRELERRVRRTLRTARRLLRAAERQLPGEDTAAIRAAVSSLGGVVGTARRAVREGQPIQLVTWDFQRAAAAIAQTLVRADLARMQEELAAVPGLRDGGTLHGLAALVDDGPALDRLAGRALSPLAAIGAVRGLLLAVDMDRSHEAQAVLPLATISVTEDMATAMRLHALGWRSVYHREVLAAGLAPDDLRSVLQQRLRWAQGTVQVLLRENPLLAPGLTLAQRLMYFATMWTYLSGIFSIIYIAAPTLYLLFGLSPVRAYSADFLWHFVPYLAVNQLVFEVVAWRLPTWRGRQYSLALFPLWITAVSGAVANAAWGRPLAFLVTPKIRQSGAPLRLVWPQLVAMAVLTLDIVVGLGHLLARSVPAGSVPAGVIVNVLWSCYDLVTMSVILRAVTYRPGRPRRRALRPGSPREGPRVARPGRRDTGGQHGGQHRDRTGEHRDGAPAGAT